MVTPIYDIPPSSRDRSYRPYYSSDSERGSPRRSRAVYTDSEDEDYEPRPLTPRSSSYERSHHRPRRQEYQRDHNDYEGRSPYPASDTQDPPRTSNVHSDYGYPSSSRHERLRPGDNDPQKLNRSHESLGDAINDEVQKYLKILPPSPNFVWSKCNGRKKAVCVSGITS